MFDLTFGLKDDNSDDDDDDVDNNSNRMNECAKRTSIEDKKFNAKAIKLLQPSQYRQVTF